jgi:hypothetical protein
MKAPSIFIYKIFFSKYDPQKNYFINGAAVHFNRRHHACFVMWLDPNFQLG